MWISCTIPLNQVGEIVFCTTTITRGSPIQIQDPISTWKQGKPTLFQDIYALEMTIDHCYWKYNYKYHHARQTEKEALKSHFQKQSKASTAGNSTASQNKANTFLAASSAKLSPSKLLFPTPKKQSNSLWVNLFFKLANNSKLISDEHKKHLKNNLCLYYSIEDHKLDFCPKKQTIVTPKGCSTSTTANPPVAASEKLLEKQKVTLRTLHRLRAALNSLIQQ